MKPDYTHILHQYFGYSQFRGIQEDIIRSIGSGHDTLGLMPTGGGKSLTFQVPALALPGVCLVITPLIALMKDQVTRLRSLGIKATAIYTGMRRDAISTALDNCILGDYKFLYLSPERLTSEAFLTKLHRMHVSFITVDESHCISQWGYDFRPAYLNIADIRPHVLHAPILALTATATAEVVADIQRCLHFREGSQVFRMSFERKNLTYVVRPTADKDHELLHILSRVPGTAIVYTRNRDHTRDIAHYLQQQGVSATYYHAGLSPQQKDQRQAQWTAGDIRVMVATNAFGMGIDKADVRLVVHYETPDSPEAYYQEAGRGGRDGLTAYAVLLYAPDDRRRLTRRISDTFPEKDFVRRVYELLCYYYQLAMGDGQGCRYDIHLADFCQAYHLPITPTESALRLLTQAGYLLYEEESEHTARLCFTVTRDELYRQRQLSATADLVIRVLLRLYSGIFTDLVFIDEEHIAQLAHIEPRELYETLLGLHRQRIVRYIPARRSPAVTFVSQRIEASHIIISPQVYEERKAAYTHRIRAMQAYVEATNECRSQLLLRYFDEHDTHPCMRCDNCRKRIKTHRGKPTALLPLKALLADHQPHPMEEIYALPLDKNELEDVLHYGMDEELFRIEGSQIRWIK